MERAQAHWFRQNILREAVAGTAPVAEALRIRPADLTQFARRNGGVFPSAETDVAARIDAIVKYLESIQERAG